MLSLSRVLFAAPVVLSRSTRLWKPCRKLYSTLNTLPYTRQCPLIPSKTGERGFPLRIWSRDVVIFSKNKGKRKTVKAVAKRFKRTGSGALKYWRPGKNHKMIVKSGRARRNLRKPKYANKQQLKLLNKMLSGI